MCFWLVAELHLGIEVEEFLVLRLQHLPIFLYDTSQRTVFHIDYYAFQKVVPSITYELISI